VKSPRSVPSRIRTENTPEPLRAHPANGPAAVRRAVLGALRAEQSLEVLDLAGTDAARLAGDPRFGRCDLLVAGAVFHYEGTVTVDLFDGKIFSGLVGYELAALEPGSGRRLTSPVVFAGRRQSDTIKDDEDASSSDRQIFEEWVKEALKVASASLPGRFVLPAVQAAHGQPPGAR
jgi:hypothetical protein